MLPQEVVLLAFFESFTVGGAGLLSKLPLITKMKVERSEVHRKVEFQIIATLENGMEHILITIFLDGAYEDLYLFHIVGSTQKNLIIEKNSEKTLIVFSVFLFSLHTLFPSIQTNKKD